MLIGRRLLTRLSAALGLSRGRSAKGKRAGDRRPFLKPVNRCHSRKSLRNVPSRCLLDPGPVEAVATVRTNQPSEPTKPTSLAQTLAVPRPREAGLRAIRNRKSDGTSRCIRGNPGSVPSIHALVRGSLASGPRLPGWPGRAEQPGVRSRFREVQPRPAAELHTLDTPPTGSPVTAAAPLGLGTDSQRFEAHGRDQE